MASVNPYLAFSGTCEAAFEFYKSVFGGEYQGNGLIRFKDMPSDQPVSGPAADMVMHVSLAIGDTYLMGSDAPEGFGPPNIAGNNFSVSINTESEAEATKIFNGLSAGGKITMPLDKSPWGSFFGMFTDKFGINWMVSYEFGKK
jgi:PhnB protein